MVQQVDERVIAEKMKGKPAIWNLGRGLLRFARQKPLGAFGAILILLMVAMAILAPTIAPYNPTEVEISGRLLPPGPTHPLGTDNFGRDVYSRILYGAQISIYIGMLATLFGTVGGSIFGLISGYLGGRFDETVQRFMDILMAFPQLVLVMALVAAIGSSVNNVVLAMAIVLTPTGNRIVRSAVLSEKERQYVEAARSMGASTFRIVFIHLLPNVTAPIVVLASITIGVVIITEASLSFLGLGPPPPTPTWGSMLGIEGQHYFEEAPWIAIAPGVAISLAVLGYNLLGDALRDVWDPRLRGT